jgi:WD40 repeat protein
MITPSGTEAISCSSDGTARVWDLEIGDCMLQISGHAGPITSMAITGDGSLLVTSSEDGTMRAYELEKGQCLRVLAGHDGPVTAMAIDPFGRFIVSGGQDKTLRFWDLASARVLKMLNFPYPVVAITLSTCNGLLLLGMEDGCVHLMDATTGVLVSKMEGHSGKVTALEFLQDTRQCISASEDGTIKIWSCKKGRNVKSIDCHDGASILVMKLLQNGDMAVTGSDDGTAKLWDLRSGNCIRVMNAQGGWVMDVAVSSKEDSLVTSTSDGVVLVWNIESGELSRVLEGHSGAVSCVQLTRKGRFAITGAEDCNVRVWDLAAPSSHIPKWHSGRIRSICGSHGIAVATAGDDCMARIWNATLGEYVGILRRHAVPIRWVFFSDDGSKLMTCSPDRHICIWDMESKEIITELQGSYY